MKTRTKKKQTEEANSPCGFVVPDRDRKYFMDGIAVQSGKAQEQQEISLRKWCIEQARVSGEVDVRMAQEIYDWVTEEPENKHPNTIDNELSANDSSLHKLKLRCRKIEDEICKLHKSILYGRVDLATESFLRISAEKKRNENGITELHLKRAQSFLTSSCDEALRSLQDIHDDIFGKL